MVSNCDIRAWKGILVGMVGLRSLLCLEFSKYIRRFPNSVFYLFKNGYIWLYTHSTCQEAGPQKETHLPTIDFQGPW